MEFPNILLFFTEMVKCSVSHVNGFLKEGENNYFRFRYVILSQIACMSTRDDLIDCV